ncbi:site-specific integrase [Algoriphagus sp. AK58]|uniref:tyrosine-type recombinase/integrase n=1 Tax=Algoriphagus sp. AK58 TaxID=1406877 RepID=UPI001650278F|nr:site-specific integrase [Algoriphagus sp. AK58]MBC6368034.1 recombinase [Algoriphagus sp. AK58]
MKVTLRERKKGKKIVLYLDYYQKGFRQIEYLDLHLIPEPEKGKLSRLEIERNKEVRRIAEQICHQKNIDFNSGKFSLADVKKQKTLVIPFFEKLKEERGTSIGNSGNWRSLLKHLKDYSHPGITFEDITKEYVDGFKNYLAKAKKRNQTPLAQNSRIAYFGKFLAGLKEAENRGFLIKNPGTSAENFKVMETERSYLTLEEVEKLVTTECEMPILKSAFLFSCLTGLRFGDLQKLQWEDFIESDSMGTILRFRQSKTKSFENLPVSDQAMSILGEKKEKGSVFPFLHYSAWNNLKLEQWFMKAGITRKVTFHSARHTHAVLQLKAGTDIYTVSKLLGHRSLKTTQIYAKVMDRTKMDAVNRIDIKSLNTKKKNSNG